MIPPWLTALARAAKVQLAGVPEPTTLVGLLVSIGWASAGRGSVVHEPSGLPAVGNAPELEPPALVLAALPEPLLATVPWEVELTIVELAPRVVVCVVSALVPDVAPVANDDEVREDELEAEPVAPVEPPEVIRPPPQPQAISRAKLQAGARIVSCLRSRRPCSSPRPLQRNRCRSP
jgi:hypothetical protein